jgi:hypothetical protein
LQEDGGWELGEKRLRQVKINIEALQPRKHGDLHWGENLPTGHLLWVRERRVRKGIGLPDRLRCHPGKGVPIHAWSETRGGPHRNRLPPRHSHLRIQLRGQIVAALQESLLRCHHLRLGGYIRLRNLLEGLHRPLGIQWITVKLKALGLPLIRLGLQGL